MKKLELENFGVQEMDANEMREMNGGVFPWLAAAVIAVTISAVNHWPDIKQGFSDAINDR